ncbi:MAG: endonuclease domain-containing protein [Candidatus Goldbacteria bacterium]|nr:endonuclease domain-containing protein [Candidatus Goldiibacteriota bacterium]
MIKYNKNLKQYSRKLRNNMTDAERCLWQKIRRRQLANFQFYRQKIIGNYIVDFYCPKANLIIEVDGGQHYYGKTKEKDRKRVEYLERLGLNILRFSDREVLENINEVLNVIYYNLKGDKSPLIPLC